MMLGKVEFELQKLLDHYVSGSRSYLIIKCILIELSYSSVCLFVSSALIYPLQLQSHQSLFSLNFRLFRYAMLIIITLSCMLFSRSLAVILLLLVSELFQTSAELLSCMEFWFLLLVYTLCMYLEWAMVFNYLKYTYYNCLAQHLYDPGGCSPVQTQKAPDSLLLLVDPDAIRQFLYI